ncbi:acetate/propionate family kinase [Desulfovibrio sp. OttesenSCG-928-O18]|nr:acetate/propionate family kinase [Desulfovibrio sp. OttesenSCG-928-O18]
MAYILVVNIGSTSLKYRLLEMDTEETLARGYIERIGSETSPMSATNFDRTVSRELDTRAGYDAAIQAMLDAMIRPQDGLRQVLDDPSRIAAVGFKAVHAGMDYRGAYELTGEVLAAMETFSGVMPAHNPPYINAARRFRSMLPNIPLVGAFETAFHKDMPDHAAVYGIPREWTEKYGVRRYGFHGASHRYVSERAAAMCGKPLVELKLITCHMGGSSSLAAVKFGKSIDTSMGFTTQSGVPMAKRVSDMDPFVLPYLMERTGLAMPEILTELTTNGGLAGISGLSGDMRDLEEAYNTNPDAKRAVDHFAHEVKKYIGAYCAVMNGVDAIVFTGGIGENAVKVRERICRNMDYLGIALDVSHNAVQRREAEISAPESRVRLFVIPTNEEIIVARETLRCLDAK